MPRSVRALYDELVARAEFSFDAAQRRLADRLDAIATELAEAGRQSKRSSLGWLLSRGARPQAPRGLYIWGAVGRGKTRLMDLFFEAAAVPRKRRVHFHAFMGEVHERIAEFRRRLKSGETSGDDPIPPVASAIAEEAGLLCFDEFSVADIADAMILGRLFAGLFEAGVTVIATSNTAPDELYAGGLNRTLFLPFLDVLKANMEVFHLDAARDYRLDEMGPNARYLTTLGTHTDARLRGWFRSLTGHERGAPRELLNKGRTVLIAEAADGVAFASFEDLCVRPLGAGDYLRVANAFHTLLLSDLPVFDSAQRNEAKRLIILIDTLYDWRRRVIISAEAEPEDLFLYVEGREREESARTVSRLVEMRSDAYWDSAGPVSAREEGARRA
jgi:cell division protein ZapE